MKFLKNLIIIIFISSTYSLQAQNTLSGGVTDGKDNSPLIRAAISIPDLKTGAISDKNDCNGHSRAPLSFKNQRLIIFS